MTQPKTYIHGEEVEVNPELSGSLEVLSENGNVLVVRIGSKVHEVHVLPSKDDPKKYEVFIGGRSYPVQIKDRADPPGKGNCCFNDHYDRISFPWRKDPKGGRG